MRLCTCCRTTTEESIDAKPSALTRASAVTRCMAPAAVLMLLPKCPMCIAGYAALAGVGISIPTAAWIRYGIICACAASLAGWAVSVVRRAARRARHLPLHATHNVR
jgi:hypothetical protein